MSVAAVIKPLPSCLADFNNEIKFVNLVAAGRDEEAEKFAQEVNEGDFLSRAIALNIAIAKGCENRIITRLIDAHFSNPNQALEFAVKNNIPFVSKYLAKEFGANLNYKLYADFARDDEAEIAKSLGSEYIDIQWVACKALAEKKPRILDKIARIYGPDFIDIDAINSIRDLSYSKRYHEEHTFLSAAIGADNPDAVKILLEKSADPNSICNSAGFTPLIVAVRQCKNFDIIDILIRAGARADITIAGNRLDYFINSRGAEDGEILYKKIYERPSEMAKNTAEKLLRNVAEKNEIDEEVTKYFSKKTPATEASRATADQLSPTAKFRE